MNLAALRRGITRLNLSAGTLVALGAAIDARACGKPFEPVLKPRLDVGLDALGGP
jgi:hypothetical protein